MRLIDADALKKTLNEIFETVEVVTFDDIIAIIDNTPTVDLWQMRQEATENALKKAEVLASIERPQGEWLVVKSPLSSETIVKCNKCGDEFIGNDVEDYNFCPNCGADMRKGEEE